MFFFFPFSSCIPLEFYTLFDRVCTVEVMKTYLQHSASSPLLSASPKFPLKSLHPPPPLPPALYVPSLPQLPTSLLHPFSRLPSLPNSSSPPLFSLRCAFIMSCRLSSSAPSQFHLCLLSSCSSCVCSHFLTLPRTRHFPPVDDPQTDPR